MTKLRVVCFACNVTLGVPPAAAGKKVRCPRCQAAVPVPEDAPSASHSAISVSTSAVAAGPSPARSPASAKQSVRPAPAKANPSAQDTDGLELDEVSPGKKGKKKRASGGKTGLILAVAGGGGVLALVLVGVVLWAAGIFGGTSSTQFLPGPKGGAAKNNEPPADEEYELRFKDFPEAGKSMAVKSGLTTKTEFKVENPDAAKFFPAMPDDVASEEYTLTVLEAGEVKPKKYQQTYQRAIQAKGGKDEAKPYQGRTVVFELQPDGAYGVSAAGQPLLPAELLDRLRKNSGNGLTPEVRKALLPERLKVGETADLDLSKLSDQAVKSMIPGADWDPSKSKASLKLVRVYDEDGKQFGELEMKISLTLKGLPDTGGLAKGQALMEIDTTMNLATDGSTTQGRTVGNMRMTFDGTFDIMGQAVKVNMKANAAFTEERSAEQDGPAPPDKQETSQAGDAEPRFQTSFASFWHGSKEERGERE